MEANDKNFARVKVLETVCEKLEETLRVDKKKTHEVIEKCTGAPACAPFNVFTDMFAIRIEGRHIGLPLLSRATPCLQGLRRLLIVYYNAIYFPHKIFR